MGFDGWPEGRDPWNVKNDVRAWQSPARITRPLVVGDDAVGKRHLTMTAARARASSRAATSRAALANLLQGWLEKNGETARSITGSAATLPIWDEVTVAYLLGMTTSKTYPRPGLRDDMTFDHARPRGTITWITSVDSEALWADLAAKSDRARKTP